MQAYFNKYKFYVDNYQIFKPKFDVNSIEL